MRETIYFNQDNGPIDIQIIDNPKSVSLKAFCGNKAYVQAATFTNSLFKEQSASFHIDGDSHYVNIKLPWIGHKNSRVWVIFISEAIQYLTVGSKEDDKNLKINPIMTRDGLVDVKVNIRYKLRHPDVLVNEINYSETRMKTVMDNIISEIRNAVAKAVTEYLNQNVDLLTAINKYLPYDCLIKLTGVTITCELSEESVHERAKMAAAATQEIFNAKMKILLDHASKAVFDIESLKEVLFLSDNVYNTSTQPPALQGAFGNDNKIKYIDE